MGDEVFHKILKSYYSTFQLSNASSTDFERIAEQISGLELTTFFNQWLRRPGVPQLSIRPKIRKMQLDLMILQLQKNELFEFPLSVKVNFIDGSSVFEKIQISENLTLFTKTYRKRIISFVVDPNVDLLFEESK